MIHGADPLFHAIVSAHADPDPRMVRRFSPSSPAPHSRHIARLLAVTPESRPSLQSTSFSTLGRARNAASRLRIAGALSTAFWAVLRPLPMVRTRQAPMCCTPGCP